MSVRAKNAPRRLDPIRSLLNRRNAAEPPAAIRQCVAETLERRRLLSTDVLTYHNDNNRDGLDQTETVLTPANVNSGSFGLKFSYSVDGQVYAEPLVVSNLTIDGAVHDVVYVATEHDGVYAFDADSNTGTSAQPLWYRSFINPSAGITTVPSADTNSGDIQPEIGITSTPVINRATNTMYVLTKTKNTTNGVVTYVQQLHALNLQTGADEQTPVTITASVTGSGAGTNSNGVITFNPLRQNDRSALTLSPNGSVVYLTYASHGDNGPYHGWILAYNTTNLAQLAAYCDTPNGTEGGIWMSGDGPALDANGNLFFTTGNGTYDSNGDFGDSFVELTLNGNSFTIDQSFTPSDQGHLNANDLDLASGGVMIPPTQGGANPDLVIGAGKEGTIYLVNRDPAKMGGYSTTSDNIVQEVKMTLGSGSFDTPAYFNGDIYYQGSGDKLKMFSLTNGTLSTTPVSTGAETLYFPGTTPVISANGNTNGIVWTVEYESSNAILHAYDATNLTHVLYNSTDAGSRDMLPAGTKFATPTVANGHVYVGTSDTLAVFGLLNTSPAPPAAPSGLSAAATSPTTVQLTWTTNSTVQTSLSILRAPGASTNYVLVGSAAASATTYVDSSCVVGATYTYVVEATNSAGSSANSNSYQVTLPTVTGLVGLWPMYEGGGNVLDDSSGLGDNGTINGEVTWEPGYVTPDDLEFHGEGVAVGDVDIPNNSAIDFTASQSFSLSAWVNPNTLPDKWAGIVAKSSDISPGYGLYLNPSNDWVFAAGSSDPNAVVGTTATVGWTFLSLVQNGSAGTRNLYVNGQLVATGAAENANGAGDLWFGGAKESTAEFFNGQIDDVSLYNLALTDAQIRALGGISTGGDTTPPTAVLTAPPLTSAGGTTYQFNVAYTDNVAVNSSSINNNDILVTGPGGYSQFATLVSTDNTNAPGTIVATYSITCPSVTWDSNSNGTYVVAVQPGAVTDTAGNPVPAGPIGSITVDISVAETEINGLVYNDINDDGAQENGEPGLPNWTVYLVNTDDDTPDPTLTSVPPGDPQTTTNSAGTFLFTGLVHDTYAVVPLAEPGWTYTQPSSGFLTVNANTGSNSDVLVFGQHQVTPSNALPAGWTDTDIGAVGVAGSGTYSNGVFTVAGGGGGIWNTADAFNFAYQTISGNSSITTEVTSNSNVNPNSGAGVMMRSSLATGATNVYLGATANGYLTMNARTPDNTAEAWTGNAPLANTPVWVRLVRTGNVVQGYYSTNNSTYNLVATVTLALPTTAYVGLAVCSNNAAALDTATFTNVSLSGTGAVIGDTTPPTASYTAPATITTAGGTSASFTITYTDNVAVNVATIGVTNVSVTGPNGPLSVTGAQVSTDTDGPIRSVVYTVVPPDGTWSTSDDGAYTVALSSQVTDTSGNAVTGNSNFGAFTVAIPGADSIPPTATLTATTITTASATAYSFNVTYNDNVAVNARTVSSSSLLVTGPNGYSENATPTTYSPTTNSSSVVATYSVPAPNGTWTSSSDGSYAVIMPSGTVIDTSGNAVAAGSLGTFSVSIPAAPGAGTLSGSAVVAAASYNLTALGTSDWEHWGRTGLYNNVDRDATGGSQISNVITVGTPANFGGNTYSARRVSWTNGTPTTSSSGDDGFIWENDVIGGGFSFTVPASTAAQTLSVYLGGYGSVGTLTATLSDGSANPFSITVSGTSNYTNLVTLNFAAASAGQTLTIDYTKSSNNGEAATGSVDLMAAWLSGTAASPTPAAPTITTNPQSQSVPAGANVTFTAAASGTPSPTVQWQYSINGGSSFTRISGATSTTLSVGSATLGETGYEYEAVFTNSVSTATSTAATLTVTAATTSGGTLSGSAVTAAASYNLTALGTSDWAHWGRGGNASNFDHDASGGSQISNVTKIGGGNYGGYTYSARKVTWTNGTPTATDSSDDGFIWENNVIGGGYSFTVPASATSQTLSIYLGGYGAQGTLTATLSDGSAGPYSVIVSGTTNFSNLVTINFAAASAGQTLTISYTKTSNNGGAASGSVDLVAAWLSGAAVSPTPTAPVVTLNPQSQSVAAGANVTFTAAATGTPSPAVQWEISTNAGVSFSPISGATSTTLSIGTATLGETGYEYEAVFTNSVTSTTTSAATLTVTSAPTSTPTLTGSAGTAAASYYLTALGTTDWAHWGRGGNASNFDHDASGGSQISNVTKVGSGSYGGYTYGARSVNWTNGTPTASDTGDSGFIWANNALGAGYSFTVPASATTHTLYIYLGGYSAGGTVTAHLSNTAAPDLSIPVSGSSNFTDLVSITFNAGAPGQTLTLSYTKTQTIGAASGSVDLVAAWLQ